MQRIVAHRRQSTTVLQWVPVDIRVGRNACRASHDKNTCRASNDKISSRQGCQVAACRLPKKPGAQHTSPPVWDGRTQRRERQGRLLLFLLLFLLLHLFLFFGRSSSSLSFFSSTTSSSSFSRGSFSRTIWRLAQAPPMLWCWHLVMVLAVLQPYYLGQKSYR